MNQVEQLLHPLVGQYVWGVDWDSQLSLRMNFGSPRLRVHKPLSSRPNERIVLARGTWWLWAYFALWKISFNGELAAKGGTSKSRSSFKRIVRATTQLSGQVVTSVRVKPKSGKLILSFDLGGQLILRPIDRRKMQDVWLFYGGEDDPILTVRSDGKFSYGKSDAHEQWLSIT